MSLLSAFLTVLLAYVLLYLVHLWIGLRRLKTLLPPSPPEIPFLGNALQVPYDDPWLVFRKWRRQYGPIFSLNMAGKPVIVLNTMECATELLDRRSNIYSDRPRLIMANNILCKGLNSGLVAYGELWRRMRRAAHDSLHVHAVHTYRQQQTADALELISRLSKYPEKFDEYFKHFAASTALSVLYGQRLESESAHQTVDSINEFAHTAIVAAAPATLPWIDVFPVLDQLPSWMVPEKRRGLKMQSVFSAMHEGTFNVVRRKIEEGSATRSLATSLLENEAKYGLTNEESAWLCGTTFAAASETTAGSLSVFILAMLLYPQVLKKAQTEIDAVVSQGRVPTFEDQDELPYVDAIIKEVLRWKILVPLGLPRRCMQDDYYNGYFIPEGATIIENLWEMSQDPDVYVDPEEFIPERFLNSPSSIRFQASRSDVQYAFGFGRRICPGKHFAYQSLYIAIASMVWAFDIRKSKDASGNIIEPSRDASINEGLVVRPALFSCDFVPRHSALAGIIAEASSQHA